jgi:ArsR family metal-binding transcriptional regulator
MTESQYVQRRRELAIEVMELKSIRCNLAAKARIRKIAALDKEFKGVDVEVTKKNFGYYNI